MPRGHASHRAMLATSATEREREAPLSVVLPERGPLSQAPCPVGHQQQRPSPALGPGALPVAASRLGFAEAHDRCRQWRATGTDSSWERRAGRRRTGDDGKHTAGKFTCSPDDRRRALGTPNSTELTTSIQQATDGFESYREVSFSIGVDIGRLSRLDFS